jgi:hypothetical protein
MFATAILILLYNKEIKDSATINSLVSTDYHYAKLVLWNNGPIPLKNIDCQILESLGYEATVEEILNNESLAVIYNKFLANNKAQNIFY